MTATINVIFAALAFALVLQSSSALKCYRCSSSSYENRNNYNNRDQCDDPMNITDHAKAFLAQDCPMATNSYGYNDQQVCKKVVLKENGKIIVRRSCETPLGEDKDIKNGQCGPSEMRNNPSIISCDICNTDYCNSADSITGSRVFQFFAIALVLSGASSFSF